MFPRQKEPWRLNKFLNSAFGACQLCWLFKNLFNKQKTNSIYCEMYRFRIKLRLHFKLQIKYQVILNGNT
jgi:hypothetical protein